MILIALEYAILASTFTIAKNVLSYSDPLFLIATRLLVAGFFLMIFAITRNVISWKKVFADRWLFIRAALFHAYFAFVPEFWALQYVTSAKASFIYALTPFVAALISYFHHHERLSKWQWVGMMTGFMSVVPLMGIESCSLTFRWALPEWVLVGAMASACYAWFHVTALMKRGHSITFINGVAMGIGGLLAAGTLLVVRPEAIHSVTAWGPFVSWLSLLILLSHFISYNLYSYLLTRYSITFMTFCGFLCPFFSAIFGVVFLCEPMSWHYGVSLIGIIGSLALFVKKRTKKGNASIY